MARIHWIIPQLPRQLAHYFAAFGANIKLLILTLCYNSFTSFDTVLDTCLEPLVWCVDHFGRYLGPVFMTMVVFLTLCVVAIVYICVLPYLYYGCGPLCFASHFIISHWLKINVFFHFLMAASTSPGHPPADLVESVSICKKCIAAKPPRAHHCSVCKMCVLKMDHHCPWVNNCIGFYNHRYFFMFCAYMWLGTLYISFAIYDLFKDFFYDSKTLLFPGALYPLNLAYFSLTKPSKNSFKNTDNSSSSSSSKSFARAIDPHDWYESAIVFEFMLCSGVVLALALLLLWHGRLITRGETCIESHINKRERLRCKKKQLHYRNPYDFGPWKNWQIFLGLDTDRSFFWHILLPSTHKPTGNGLKWTTIRHKKPRQMKPSS